MFGSYWVVPPEWRGETCFILAGGPSLENGVPFHRLREFGRVLVINASFRLVPDADCLYFCDRTWWAEYGGAVEERFRGRYLVTLESEIPGIKRLRCTGAVGLETNPSGLRTGSNSGYQAINLAVHFGASRVVLLGYDMQVQGARTHWHEGYPGQSPGDFAKVLARQMLPKFQSLVEPLRRLGIAVVNATPGSCLQCWPQVKLERLLI